MRLPTIHLLLIEDNPGDARLLREMLHDAPDVIFDLVWVDRLAKGIELLQAGNLDAALVDLSLPDASDLDSVVRTRQVAPELPIIVLTGSTDRERGLRAVREGAQDYLIKGDVNVDLVARTVQYAIERKRTEAKIARYARELRARNEQMRADLALAQEIQLALLPHDYPVFPPGVTAEQSALSFHHYYQGAAYLAGDFFDIFPVSETAAGIFICDVMGHGVRAALITAMIRPLVDDLITRAAEPGALLDKINQELIAILRQANTTIYATAFYLVADIARGQFTYANAGHPAPLHLRRQHGDVVALHTDGHNGPALGLFEHSTFTTHQSMFDPGDVALFFTDGLFEVTNATDEEYGTERLLQTVRRLSTLSAAELIPALLADVQQFAAQKEFTDDVCLVGLQARRKG